MTGRGDPRNAFTARRQTIKEEKGSKKKQPGGDSREDAFVFPFCTKSLSLSVGGRTWEFQRNLRPLRQNTRTRDFPVVERRGMGTILYGQDRELVSCSEMGQGSANRGGREYVVLREHLGRGSNEECWGGGGKKYALLLTIHWSSDRIYLGSYLRSVQKLRHRNPRLPKA